MMEYLNIIYFGFEFVWIYILFVEGVLVVEDFFVIDKDNDWNILFMKCLVNEGYMCLNWIIIICCMF